MTQRARPAPAPRAASGHDAAPPQPRSIAVVDDDEHMREALADLLAAAGYSVKSFGSAEDFLSSTDLSHVDCLVSDVNMPGLNGPDLYMHLRNAGNALPTILVTAYPTESSRLRCLEMGVSCYLEKPLEDEELLACIRCALTLTRPKT
jgi:FixJ family two-component response regulator